MGKKGKSKQSKPAAVDSAAAATEVQAAEGLSLEAVQARIADLEHSELTEKPPELKPAAVVVDVVALQAEFEGAADKAALFVQTATSQARERARANGLAAAREELHGLYYKTTRQARAQDERISKLDALARALQKHNKLVVEASAETTKKEAAMRVEQDERIQALITKVQAQLATESTTRTQVVEHNDILQKKLEQMSEVVVAKEKHSEMDSKRLDLELQLAEARRKQAEALAAQETAKCAALADKAAAAEANEGELRRELLVYKRNYDKFEASMNTSNELIASFKEKSEHMTALVTRSERDNTQIRDKHAAGVSKLSAAVGRMAGMEKELGRAKHKADTMGALCQTLQSELRAERKRGGELEVALAGLAAAAMPDDVAHVPPGDGEADGDGEAKADEAAAGSGVVDLAGA